MFVKIKHQATLGALPGYYKEQVVPTQALHGFFLFLFFYFRVFLLFFFFNFIYLFILSLAVLGLHFCTRAFSSCSERGPLTIAASLVGSTGSRCAGSVVVAHGPSCSAACGIFLDQGSNPCPLHWQADSQPLRHQGSPSAWLLHYCTL